MYKFYVQNSSLGQYVVVDLKLQDPAEGKKLSFARDGYPGVPWRKWHAGRIPTWRLGG